MTTQLTDYVRQRRLLANGSGRVLREASGISLRSFARLIDVPPATLSRWERGVSHPNEVRAARWEEALNALMRGMAQ